MSTVAVILAAGGSTRMGFPKQPALIKRESVIARSLKAFQNTDSVSYIVLVTRPEDQEPFTQMCAEKGITKLYAVCKGGDTRQQSAQNSLAVLPPDADIIMIHDGARPLVTPDIICRVEKAAREIGGAAAAMPVKDTIKSADVDGLVTGTPDRSVLYQVQTPQAFRLDLYKDALQAAADKGLNLTDDCQVFEQQGLPVKLVEGSYENLKITTPEDLIMAAALLGE